MSTLINTTPAWFLLIALGVNAWRDARNDKEAEQ